MGSRGVGATTQGGGQGCSELRAGQQARREVGQGGGLPASKRREVTTASRRLIGAGHRGGGREVEDALDSFRVSVFPNMG